MVIEHLSHRSYLHKITLQFKFGGVGSDFVKARALLKEASYDGTPIVLLYATDTNTGRLTPVVKALLEKAGLTEGANSEPGTFVVEKAFVGDGV